MKVKEGYYKHYKGKVYLVIGIAKHSETLENMVVYKAMYDGTFGFDTLWVRPESMFSEYLEFEGKWRFRFEPISGAEALELEALSKV